MGPLREPSTDTQHAATPVDLALSELITGLDRLVKAVDDGGLDYYNADELIGFMHEFERFRHRLSARRPPRTT